MAKFEKGHTKIGGRPAGTPNKTTEQLRGFWQLLLEENEGRIKKELSTLEGKDFLNAIFQMTEYVLPKLQRTEITGADGDELNIIFRIATEQDANEGDTD